MRVFASIAQFFTRKDTHYENWFEIKSACPVPGGRDADGISARPLCRRKQQSPGWRTYRKRDRKRQQRYGRKAGGHQGLHGRQQPFHEYFH